MLYEGIKLIVLPLLMLAGALECFAGYKLIKDSTLLWGFLMGAVIGVDFCAEQENLTSGTIAAVVAGMLVLGIADLIVAWKWPVAGEVFQMGTLVIVVLVFTLPWAAVSVLLGVAVGVWTVFHRRRAIIVTTAFSGACVILLSAYALVNMTGYYGVAILMGSIIMLAGILCQMITTKPEEASASVSEPAYPGFQRAYRNYCICCGYALDGETNICPHCGFCQKE